MGTLIVVGIIIIIVVLLVVEEYKFQKYIDSVSIDRKEVE